MNRKTTVRAIPVILVLVIIAIVYYTGTTRQPPYKADVSDIKMETVEIKRFEELLFNINPFQLHEQIKPHIDEFYFFLGDEIDNPVAQQQLYDYITDPLILDLYDETMLAFPDLDKQEKELTSAFKYYKYHFPEKEIPEIFSYVSGLDVTSPIKYKDDNIAIGLDMYLGEEHEIYEQAGIPKYQVIRRSPKFITRDVMYILGEDLIGNNFKTRTLLDNMIYEGIKLYFLDCILPDLNDTTKIAYTSEQEAWMEHNKGHVWSYFIDNELLFSAKRQEFSSFITEAPFTSAFTRDSPPRVAIWIGWQIVREYMERNQDVALRELITKTDSEEILSKSRYKP